MNIDIEEVSTLSELTINLADRVEVVLIGTLVGAAIEVKVSHGLASTVPVLVGTIKMSLVVAAHPVPVAPGP
jgi:hypothetical protein